MLQKNYRTKLLVPALLFLSTLTSVASAGTKKLPLATDASLASLVSPTTTGCYSASQSVIVSIGNPGTTVISNIPVTIVVGGPFNQTITNTFAGSINPGSSTNFNVGNINMSLGGVYTFTCSTNLSGDANPSNNLIITTRTVNPIVNITGPSYICSGNSANLSLSGSATSFTWSTGATVTPISVSPTSNTNYSVIATNTSGCFSTASLNVAVYNPTINTTGTISCGNPATGILSANAFTPSIINWYSSPTSTTSLGTGINFSVSSAFTQTYYAQASVAAPGSLFTTLAAGNNFKGTMFDVTAITSITLDSLELHFNSTQTSSVEVWYRAGSFVGFETSNTGWTQAFTGTVNPLGTGVLSPIPGTFAITIPAGQTFGIYVTTNGGSDVYYSNGTTLGNLFASNSDLQLFEGKGGGYFNVTGSPRVFNGKLHYTTQGCTTPMTPVVFTVAPSATISAAVSSTAVCSGKSVTLTANGGTTYTWNPGGANTTSLVVSPSVTTIYTLTGGFGNCFGTSTRTLVVNPSPNLSVTPSPTVLPGTIVTLTVGGANSYSWTPGGSNNNSILVSVSSTTNYSVTGTNNFGCSSTATTAIVITLVGIKENSTDKENIILYPNPNAGVFTVKTEEHSAYTFELYDVSGKQVFSITLSQPENKLNLNALAKGLYTYKITSAEAKQIIKRGKLIKE